MSEGDNRFQGTASPTVHKLCWKGPETWAISAFPPQGKKTVAIDVWIQLKKTPQVSKTETSLPQPPLKNVLESCAE